MMPQANVDNNVDDVEQPPTSEKQPGRRRPLLALTWTALALGAFILLSAIALGAAIVFDEGFVGWLLTVGVMALAVSIIALVVDYLVHRPER